MTDETTGPGPVQDPAVRARVAALHAEGKGRNAIAAELGLGNSTVTRIAKALGLDFSRAQTAVAVQARSTNLADMRLRLAQKMADVADEQLDRAGRPYRVYAFGGAENVFNEEILEEPPAEVVRTMVATAAMAFDKVTKYLEKDTSGVETAHSLLDTLAAGFAAAAATYESPPETSPAA
jgi:hypothetical protein